MTADEWHVWQLYRQKNGPMNPMLRTDAAIARAVSPFIQKTTPRDFMPWPKEPEVEATVEDVFRLIKTAARK